jgi:hypothetical protein
LGRNTVRPRGCQKALPSSCRASILNSLTDPENPYTSTFPQVHSNCYSKIFMTMHNMEGRSALHLDMNGTIHKHGGKICITSSHEWHNPQGWFGIKLKNLIQTVW